MQKKVFGALKEHFVRTTVIRQFNLTESELLQNKTNASISINAKEPYQQFAYKEETPADLESKSELLNPVFGSFCEDGQKWI